MIASNGVDWRGAFQMLKEIDPCGEGFSESLGAKEDQDHSPALPFCNA